MNKIQSKNHRTGIYEINKISLVIRFNYKITAFSITIQNSIFVKL